MMIDELKIAYTIAGILSVGSYVPQIWTMMKKSNENDSSLISWFIWWSTSIVGVAYARYVTKDLLFTMTSVGHLIGTSTILLIQLYKRSKV
ncbi:MAG TPA: hypothetical protein VFM18_04410 [Methanosarcina sp.]|nr:hypothetical protein [Methanosarcina sp.]